MRLGRLHLAMGFLLALAVFLAGCGGGGPKTLTITSNASLDGVITKDVISTSYSKKMDETEAKTGSEYTLWILPPELGGGTIPIRSHHRILFSFDLAALAGAAIQSAKVRFYFNREEGDPVRNCGVVIIDHVYYGTDLTDTDPQALYGGYCITPDIGFTGGELCPGEWISTDVTDLVQADVDAGRGSSQYRLYHSTELPGSFTTNELSYWSSGGSATNRPELVVTYTR